MLIVSFYQIPSCQSGESSPQSWRQFCDSSVKICSKGFGLGDWNGPFLSRSRSVATTPEACCLMVGNSIRWYTMECKFGDRLLTTHCHSDPLLGQKKISTLASCLPKDPPKARWQCLTWLVPFTLCNYKTNERLHQSVSFILLQALAHFFVL